MKPEDIEKMKEDSSKKRAIEIFQEEQIKAEIKGIRKNIVIGILKET